MTIFNDLEILLSSGAEENLIRKNSYDLVRIGGVDKVEVINFLLSFKKNNELTESYEDYLYNVMSDVYNYM